MIAQLYFQWDDMGRWQAESAVTDPDIDMPGTWVIYVCDDGTFSVNDSDRVLLPQWPRSTFDTFREARAWCDARELELLREEGRAPSP